MEQQKIAMMQIQTTLPRDQKEVLANALEEKKRRIRENGIQYYIPQDQQSPFHRSTKKIRLVLGGNRSGKSIGGAAEAVWYALGIHPYKRIPVPNYGRIVCTDFTNGIEKVILPEVKGLMPKDMILGYNVESKTMTLRNGSTIEFMSYDQDVDKFESASRHWIWFDEEPPQDIYSACQMRVLDTKGDIWITMTPTHGMTWVYSELYEKAPTDRIGVFMYSTYDNPYIDDNTIDEITRGFSDAEKEARTKGTFIQMSGLIYSDYRQEVHNIPRFTIPSHCPRICGIDPHPRNPTAVLYMAVVPIPLFMELCKKAKIELKGEIRPTSSIDAIYIVYDEIYPSEQKLISQMAEMMKAHEGDDYISYRLIDNSSNTPDPIIGTTVRQEFEKYGIRTVLADKDVSNRIFKVRERLQTNTLYFFNDLHNVNWEIRHYAWDDYKIGRDYKDPKEKPRKKRDHLMDDLGYMCLSSPRFEQRRIFRPARKTVDKDTGY